METLPAITLDTTLSELFAQSGSKYLEGVAHVFCGVSAALDLTPDFPRSVKYVYQEGTFNKSSAQVDDAFRQSTAIKFLSLVTQRDAFITGSHSVIFFHTGQSDEQQKHDIGEAHETLSVLNSSQRPSLVFCTGPAQLQELIPERKIRTLTSKVVVDGIAQVMEDLQGDVEALVDFDTVFFLNSKAALAASGLPTPKTQILKVAKFEDKAKWRSDQMLRIIDAVRKHKLPFVMKGNQAFAGSGTFLVEDESARTKLVEETSQTGHLKNLLSHITAENEHLGLATTLFSDMVTDVRTNLGLTFFVASNGTATFLAASEQMIQAESAAWLGSTIVYSRQEQLQRKLAPLMTQIATWLHGHGYIGPAGADILETSARELLIVDLNLRTSGSLCLPLLKTHFTSRGWDAAGSFSITVPESREQFIERWRTAFDEGRMCIVAWYDARRALGESFGDVVVGAHDEAALGRMIEEVRESSGTLTF